MHLYFSFCQAFDTFVLVLLSRIRYICFVFTCLFAKHLIHMYLSFCQAFGILFQAFNTFTLVTCQVFGTFVLVPSVKHLIHVFMSLCQSFGIFVLVLFSGTWFICTCLLAKKLVQLYLSLIQTFGTFVLVSLSSIRYSYTFPDTFVLVPLSSI